ncbi:hypothetical protein HZF02_20035 [Pseudomonas yamanorum]|nr:hypothetical protein HZF02_10595 [Pseudomonas yamanorum]QLG94095.1 hypothetical protein HZF02_20035 [Pseudomonas yamanorum]
MTDKEVKRHVTSVWNGTALELFESIEAAITKAASKDSSPTHLANEATLGIVQAMGGRVIYIPRGHRHNQDQRNKEMYALWRNHDVPVSDLAKKYRLASASVYEIISSLAKSDGLEKSKNRFIK